MHIFSNEIKKNCKKLIIYNINVGSTLKPFALQRALEKNTGIHETSFLCSDAERERVKVIEILITTVNIRMEKSNYLTI